MWLKNRQRIRYWVALLHERGWKSTVHYDRCLTIFRKLYEGVDGYQVSLQGRNRLGFSDNISFTYGEVVFFSFVRILEMAKPQPGEIFYDLGSGAGKAVFIAGLTFEFSKACGIEKLKNLYTLSQSILDKLMQLPERHTLIPYQKINMQFIHGDFQDFDYLDADIIFINAACFVGGMLENVIIPKLQVLKKGARVIIATANLDNIEGFQLIYENMHLMSWGLSSVKIYERVDALGE